MDCLAPLHTGAFLALLYPPAPQGHDHRMTGIGGPDSDLVILTIWLVPVVRDASNWGWSFLVLSAGPAIGITAMTQLRLDSVRSNEMAKPLGGHP